MTAIVTAQVMTLSAGVAGCADRRVLTRCLAMERGEVAIMILLLKGLFKRGDVQ